MKAIKPQTHRGKSHGKFITIRKPSQKCFEVRLLPLVPEEVYHGPTQKQSQVSAEPLQILSLPWCAIA